MWDSSFPFFWALWFHAIAELPSKKRELVVEHGMLQDWLFFWPKFCFAEKEECLSVWHQLYVTSQTLPPSRLPIRCKGRQISYKTCHVLQEYRAVGGVSKLPLCVRWNPRTVVSVVNVETHEKDHLRSSVAHIIVVYPLCCLFGTLIVQIGLHL